jgi:hypothetical protein
LAPADNRDRHKKSRVQLIACLLIL